jgi:hypothetical protein
VRSKQALAKNLHGEDLHSGPIAGVPKAVSETPEIGSVATFEYKFILLFALGLCGVSSIPYMVGRVAPFPGSVFTDILAYEADANNYLAYAHQAAAGAWLFHNPMTGEPHTAVFFNFEWLLMGKVAAVFHLSPGSAMNVLRLLFAVIMCFAVYWLSAYCLHNIFLRRAALVAVMTGGGFGWLLLSHLLNVLRVPVDQSYFYDLRAGLFPYFWTLMLPHFLVAGAFATLGLCLYLRAERNRRVSNYIGAGLLYLLTGSCRPYDMAYLAGATGLYLGISFVRSKKLSWAFILRATPILMCVPLLGYYYWIFRIHPVFRWWSNAGRVPPAPWALTFSFGLSFFILLLALWHLRAQRLGDAGTLMVSCLVTTAALIYSYRFLHFSFQFATDILVPLVMVVFLGLERPLTQWIQKGRWARVSIMILLAVNGLTSVALTAQTARLAWRGSYRIDQRLVEAYTWLDNHSQPDELVLADFDNSNRIPQYGHNRVFCGYSNTVRFAEKTEAVDLFFVPGTSNVVREGLLRQNAIRYVLLNQEEARQLTVLRNAPFVNQVFANDAAVIYAVPAM